MTDLFDYIASDFSESNLDPENFDIASRFHLRFELGGGFENGTIERVNQSTKRATTLFEEIFELNQKATILISWYSSRAGLKVFWSPTMGYLQEQIMDFANLKKNRKEKFVEEFDNAMDVEKNVMEWTDFSGTHIVEALEQQVNKINYENAFRGIANLEMGFDPSIGESVYFLNHINKMGLHMYDDRGCMIYSNTKEDLKPLYIKYNHWLVDYHRPTFDEYYK
jgi:hypothetical protein